MWQKEIGMDGEIYDSKSEAKVADWLFVNDIEYEPHKRIPKSHNLSDFYLPEYDLWVEYDGLMEVRVGGKLELKKELYHERGLNLLVITRDNWQRDLLEQIELGG